MNINPNIALSPDARDAKIHRVCGCVEHRHFTTGNALRGGTFRTPSNWRFLVRMTNSKCPQCIAKEMEKKPMLWHSFSIKEM